MWAGNDVHDTTRLAPPIGRGIEAMIDVVVDQGFLGLANGLLDGVELLGDIETGSSLLDHRNDAPQVSFRPLQPLHDIRVALMNVCILHALSYPPR
jgi:hypothetical protein